MKLRIPKKKEDEIEKKKKLGLIDLPVP